MAGGAADVAAELGARGEAEGEVEPRVDAAVEATAAEEPDEEEAETAAEGGGRARSGADPASCWTSHVRHMVANTHRSGARRWAPIIGAGMA